jgi:hypothetical protein
VYRDGLKVLEIKYDWFFNVAGREWAAEKRGATQVLFDSIAGLVRHKGNTLTDDEMQQFCDLIRLYIADSNLDALHIICYD